MRRFYDASLKTLAPPLKILGTKNMRNLGRFYTNSDWSRISLRWLKTSKIGRPFFCVRRNKFGELWFTIQKVWREFGPTQINFFGRLCFP